MTKSNTAAKPAASRSVSISAEEAAVDALERLAEASGRVMALQTRVVIMALTEGSTRYAEALDALAQNSATLCGRQFPRSSAHYFPQYFLEPLRALMDTATGLQAVMLEAQAQAQAQASALLAFPALPRPAASRVGFGNRRLTSVVIPFPDRRARAAA